MTKPERYMGLVQRDPKKQPLTSDGRRICRVRMATCSCGGQLALGMDLSDGSVIEFDDPCPMCGDPTRGRSQAEGK